MAEACALTLTFTPGSGEKRSPPLRNDKEASRNDLNSGSACNEVGGHGSPSLREVVSTMATVKKSSSKKSAAKKAPAKKSARKKSATKTGGKKHAAKTSAAKKSGGRKYDPSVGKRVEREMHEMHEGTLTSGRSGKKVTNPKQAIAIALSEKRREGAKVPPNPNTGN